MFRHFTWTLGLVFLTAPLFTLASDVPPCFPPPVPPPRPIPPTPPPPPPTPYENIIYERVWIPETVSMVAERVWVPPTYEYRPVIYYDEHGHKIIRYEYVLVRPGRYETQYRKVVIPGHWKWIEKRLLTKPTTSPVPSVGVEGYARAASKSDEGVFSPLTEWPK